MQIALMLPFHGRYARKSLAISRGFFAAYYAAKQPAANRPYIEIFDTSRSDIDHLYDMAVQNGNRWVVGPLTKGRIVTLAHHYLSVPVLALNIIDSSAPLNRPNFYQFGLSIPAEVEQMVQKVFSQGYRNALIITVDRDWGQAMARHVATLWQKRGARVVGIWDITSSHQLAKKMRQWLGITQSEKREQQLRRTLEEPVHFIARRRNDIEVIFLLTTSAIAYQIKPLLSFYYAAHIPVYASSAIYSGMTQRWLNQDLNGVMFCDMPWVLEPTKSLPMHLKPLPKILQALWPAHYRHDRKLYALGVDAYALIYALQAFPSQGLKGATGRLFVGQNRQIHRQLTWAIMVHGTPKRL